VRGTLPRQLGTQPTALTKRRNGNRRGECRGGSEQDEHGTHLQGKEGQGKRSPDQGRNRTLTRVAT